MVTLTKKADRKGAVLHPCPVCGAGGIVDFVDLVRGRAEVHCRQCPTSWAERTQAKMAHLVERK